jgi:hypothetical protein
MTQVQQMQPRTRRSSKRETSGRLGLFMPQISRDENVKINNKTCNKETAKNNKKTQPRDNCAMGHTHNTCLMDNADNQLTPSRATTEQAQAATTTTKTKITISILINN